MSSHVPSQGILKSKTFKSSTASSRPLRKSANLSLRHNGKTEVVKRTVFLASQFRILSHATRGGSIRHDEQKENGFIFLQVPRNHLQRPSPKNQRVSALVQPNRGNVAVVTPLGGQKRFGSVWAWYQGCCGGRRDGEVEMCVYRQNGETGVEGIL